MRRPVSVGEINRELTVLKRMFSLAIEAGKLHHKPHFAMLREDNVRVGFFEREQYEAVLAHLPEAMRPVVTFAYVTGLADQQRGAADSVAAGRSSRRRGSAGSRHHEESRGAGVLPDPGTPPAPEGAARHRRRDPAAEEDDRAARVLPSPNHQGRRSAGTWSVTASPGAASTKPGGGRGRRPGVPAAFRTTSVERPSATWSVRAFRSAWP